MPTLVWYYLTALLYYRTSASCVALAEALQTVSHDRLTRLLHADWSGQRLLELACRTLFVWKRGYLIIDDTVIAKPFATAIEGLAWVYSSQAHKPVYGLSLVLLVWTNGTVRLPLGMRLWHKGGPSKYALLWNCSVMLAIACAVARSMCSLTRGTPLKRSSNAFAAMDGILCVA
jgi:DDE superfamily endonuclease